MNVSVQALAQTEWLIVGDAKGNGLSRIAIQQSHMGCEYYMNRQDAKNAKKRKRIVQDIFRTALALEASTS